MNIRALVKRIRAGIGAGIRARVSRGRPGRRWSRSGLEPWEAFDKASLEKLLEDIDEQAGEDASELSEALRNLN
jgi:hypothetical protein